VLPVAAAHAATLGAIAVIDCSCASIGIHKVKMSTEMQHIYQSP
jgi:hypothetical protein